MGKDKLGYLVELAKRIENGEITNEQADSLLDTFLGSELKPEDTKAAEAWERGYRESRHD